MLSVNAQENPDNPLLKKNGQVHTAGCLLLMNTIFPKSNLLT
jgi:hypothetical protein